MVPKVRSRTPGDEILIENGDCVSLRVTRREMERTVRLVELQEWRVL